MLKAVEFSSYNEKNYCEEFVKKIVHTRYKKPVLSNPRLIGRVTSYVSRVQRQTTYTLNGKVVRRERVARERADERKMMKKPCHTWRVELCLCNARAREARDEADD